jgi:hypothetical protein
MPPPRLGALPGPRPGDRTGLGIPCSLPGRREPSAVDFGVMVIGAWICYLWQHGNIIELKEAYTSSPVDLEPGTITDSQVMQRTRTYVPRKTIFL